MLFRLFAWSTSNRRRQARVGSTCSKHWQSAIEGLESRLVLSHLGDVAVLSGYTSDPALNDVQPHPPGPSTGATPIGFATYSTLGNGMPVLNSFSGAPTAIYLDFDGDTSGSNPYGDHTVSPYTEDADGTTFNTSEQRNIYEAWREVASYFSIFNINVTTVQPPAATPKAWLAVGNNISGGYSYVGVFPNSTPESWNNSGDARTRVSGLAHELGHNFGLQHQSTYDQWGVKTAEYAGAVDALHGPIMGIDYSGTIHKFFLGHNATSTGVTTLQDDIAIIAAEIAAQAGGDGFRIDDFGNSIATAAALPTSGAAQWSSAIIERMGDVDAFSFTSAGGMYALSAAPDAPSGVDLKLEIYAADGTLIAANDGANNVQELSMNLAAGTYYALVSSHGNYGDVGSYFMSVSELPAGWSSVDVGVGVSGYTVYDSATGTFNPVGTGVGLTSTADGFQYAYQTLNGDGTIIARVANVDNTSANAVTGVTIRETTAANAKQVSVAKTYGAGPKLFSRSTAGGGTSTTIGSVSSHSWLKLVRAGNVFTGFTSADGNTWTQLGAATTVTMTSSVTVGLLTASANNHALNVGQLDNVSVTGSLGVTPPTYNSLSAVTGLIASLGTGSGLSLVWSSVVGATGYAVDRSINGIDFTQIGTTASTSYNDLSLAGSMRYFYRVSATDAVGRSIPSATSSAINRPSAVTNFSITSPSATQLVMNWRETTGETGYRIERSDDGGATFSTLATVGANVPSYTNAGLTAGTPYSYRVIPTSALGDGVTSATASGAARLAAVNPTLGTVAAGSITINWSDISNETNYRIERSTNGTTFTTLATVAANTLTYTDATVTSAGEYYYRVFGTTALTQSLTGTVKFAAAPSTSPPTAPWSSQDIGSVAGPGTTDLTSGTFKLVSSGSSINGTSDSFRYTSQALVGDGEITAQVATVENTAADAKVGVMIRQSTAANSANAFVYVTPTLIGFSYRTTAGGSTTIASTVNGTAPRWVRLVRSGNSFTASYSSDGTAWTQIGSPVNITMTGTAAIGLAATSNSTTLLNTSTITNVTIPTTVGFNVSAPSPSATTTETGGTVTFTVSLTVAPTADVTVPVSTSNPTEGTVSTSLLTFTTANWSTPQTVTVTGVNDTVDDNDVAYSVILGAATSSDSRYNGMNPADVNLTNQDDDTAGVTVSAPSGTATTEEAGGMVTFTIRLNSQPTADVTIPLSSSDTSEGTVAPTSLLFTPLDWNVTQTVTVTGVDDSVYDGNVAYTVLIGAATSADATYNGQNPADIALTNTDNDPQPATKFYVVDDGTTNQTYEYAEAVSGSATSITNYSINSGNTTPRGIATNAAGTTVWVIDKNRKVFVYNDAGVSQGSWTAGSLNQSATVEGITTDGTSIWIVDAKSDSLLYYQNAASRTSGTQNATSSFALNSANKNPKDLVTDGTYLWVVNDSTTDKVFKYNLSGSLLGSWTINSANSAPTGITIDLSNSSDLWIVDSGTDRVYQYANGRSFTASPDPVPTLAGSFALDAGNTNPQGIADPAMASLASQSPLTEPITGPSAIDDDQHAGWPDPRGTGSQFPAIAVARKVLADESLPAVEVLDIVFAKISELLGDK